MRKFKIILGSSIFSTSIVIAAFMMGLLLGSWWIGNRLKKGRKLSELRYYGMLEAGIGIYAFLFIWIIENGDVIYSWVQTMPSALFGVKLLLIH